MAPSVDLWTLKQTNDVERESYRLLASLEWPGVPSGWAGLREAECFAQFRFADQTVGEGLTFASLYGLRRDQKLLLRSRS